MKKINKQFVPYTLALKLKELGYDEGCLKMALSDIDMVDSERTDSGEYPRNSDLYSGWTTIPLFSQAFEWMREKHELVVDWNHSQYDNAGSYIGVSIKNIHLEETIVGVYKSYEEAQEECLTKLIEIVENGNK
jgi:hypothetical protein